MDVTGTKKTEMEAVEPRLSRSWEEVEWQVDERRMGYEERKEEGIVFDWCWVSHTPNA